MGEGKERIIREGNKGNLRDKGDVEGREGRTKRRKMRKTKDVNHFGTRLNQLFSYRNQHFKPHIISIVIFSI